MEHVRIYRYRERDVKDSRYVMEFTDPSLTSTYTYTFSNNDRTLLLTSQDGLTMIYIK